MTKAPVGKNLWAHTFPGTTQMCALQCLLCREILVEHKGEGPADISSMKKGVALHFMLQHDIEATDL